MLLDLRSLVEAASAEEFTGAGSSDGAPATSQAVGAQTFVATGSSDAQPASSSSAGTQTFAGVGSSDGAPATSDATGTAPAAETPPAPSTIPRLWIYGAGGGSAPRRRAEPVIGSPVIRRSPPPKPEPVEPEPATVEAFGGSVGAPATSRAAGAQRIDASAASSGAPARSIARGTMAASGTASNEARSARTAASATVQCVLTGRSDGASAHMRIAARRTFRDDPLELALLGIDVGQGDLIALLAEAEELALAS